MLTRYEFIGLQDGETVFGHSYEKDKKSFMRWLKSEGIEQCVSGYAGFVPEDFVLEYPFVATIFSVLGKKDTAILHFINQLVLDGMIEINNIEDVVEAFKE